MDDKGLILQTLEGNSEAFDSLVLRHWDRALLFSLRILHDYHAAEDILQDSFAAAYIHLPEYNPCYSFKTWLYTIVKNRCLSYLRKNKPRPENDFSRLCSDERLEESFLQRETAQEIRSQVSCLKRDHRLVITLVDFDSLSYREAARVMGKSESQIKSLLFRARNALRKQIERS
ncbi:MAG: RNA polymerase sigma factor [Christensenellales bacterium]|jgi:RNA polymerase sigma factor (sigma-70 family)